MCGAMLTMLVARAHFLSLYPALTYLCVQWCSLMVWQLDVRLVAENSLPSLDKLLCICVLLLRRVHRKVVAIVNDGHAISQLRVVRYGIHITS